MKLNKQKVIRFNYTSKLAKEDNEIIFSRGETARCWSF